MTNRIEVTNVLNKGWIRVSGGRIIRNEIITTDKSIAHLDARFVGMVGSFGVYNIIDPR